MSRAPAGNYECEVFYRLHHIQRPKDIVFTLHEIRQLQAGQVNHQPCRELSLQLMQKIESINKKIVGILGFEVFDTMNSFATHTIKHEVHSMTESDLKTPNIVN